MAYETIDMPVVVERRTATGVILRYAEPCHFCGLKHQHGNETAAPDADMTYGFRSPHCPSHDKAGRWLGMPMFGVRLIASRGEV